MPEPRLASVFRQPFVEQVAFFRGKLGNLVPTEKWTDLWKGQHDTAFMVAGAMKADLLADLAGAVDRSIAEGKSLQWFRANFDEIAAKHGWAYRGERNWRTRVIYQTNISTSYAAGREAQIAAGGYRYKLYKHSDSVLHPRPHHVSWDGLVLPVDHPFWDTHSAPNGWGCKCRIVGIRNEAAARRLGGRWGDNPPAGWDEIDAKTGEPVGIDKGWGYQPGASNLADRLAGKLKDLPPPLAKALQVDLANPPPWDVSTPTGQWHQAAFAHSPDYLRRAVAATGEVKITERIGVTSHQSGDRITMGHPMDTPIGKAVWRHEFGHRMDNARAKYGFMRSKEPDFTSAMEADSLALKTGSGMGRTSKAQAKIFDDNRQAPRVMREQMQALPSLEARKEWLSKAAESNGLDLDEFRAWFSAHTAPGDLKDGGVVRDWWEARFLDAWRRRDAQGLLDAMEQMERGELGQVLSGEQTRAHNKGMPGVISDLFSAATNKRVEGCGGHSASYYKDRAGWGRQAESWANITSVIGTGPVGEALLQRFTPAMFQVFKDAL